MLDRGSVSIPSSPEFVEFAILEEKYSSVSIEAEHKYTAYHGTMWSAVAIAPKRLVPRLLKSNAVL